MTDYHLDFETRSLVDLRKCGVHRYAEHESTDVICLAIRTKDDCCVWVPPWVHEKVPEYTAFSLAALAAPDARLFAFNSQFERSVWEGVMARKYGAPSLPVRQWHCVAARAASLALPRRLEDVAKALKLPVKKDAEGHRLMLQMCKPRPAGGWFDDTGRLRRLIEYCVQDTEVEMLVHEKLGELPEAEREIYLLDQHINDRGFAVDVLTVKRLREIVLRELRRLNGEIQRATGGRVTSAGQNAKLLNWLREQGLAIENVQAATISGLLLRGDLPEIVELVLRLRQEAAKSSTTKLDAMARSVCEDGRVRGGVLYHGASTGRWSGKLVQVQNLPRNELSCNPEEAAFALCEIGQDYAKEKYGPLLSIVSSGLRCLIQAEPGKSFFGGDYSQVEARVLAWLAGETAVLQAFASGRDPYKLAASEIFAAPVGRIDKTRRLVGKVAVLALGYQGGIGAFATFSRGYQVDLEVMTRAILPGATLQERIISQRLAEWYFEKAPGSDLSISHAIACDIVKARWRKAHSRIVSFWCNVYAAACEAVKTGKPITCGRVVFGTKGKTLFCRLPSGRCLAYQRPKMDGDRLTAYTLDSVTHKWTRRPYYGGILAENITQAVARDLLAQAMLRLEVAGYPLVMTVHDEVVCEAPEGADFKRFSEIMASPPKWAKGLPIEVDTWRGRRYRK